MENRVLLAFALSIGVFILWGYFLAVFQSPPREGKKQKPSELVKKEAPVRPGTARPLEPGFPAPKTTEPYIPLEQETLSLKFPGTEKIVEVKTGRVTFIFSNKGAVLKKALVQKYTDEDGNPIDLVNSEEVSIYPLTLLSDNAEINYILANAYFDTSSDFLELFDGGPAKKLTMHLQHESGLEVHREFSFNFDQYLFQVVTRIQAPALAQKNIKYTVVWGPDLGGETESKTDYFTFSGPTTFIDNKRVETPADEVKDIFRHKGTLTWTAIQNKYFAAAMIPQDGIKNAVALNKDDGLYVGLELQTVQSAANASYLMYIGTKELQVLEDSGHDLVRLIDYGWFGNKFAFLVKPILKALNYFYGLTGNYGWSIIFLTCIIKLLFSPLSHKSFKSMKGMQKIQPYVKIIQQRNKDNRQKMNEELLDLYKKNRVNPLGGCLPMLLQIPVFIALYHALFFSIELRGAPFMLWIQDLSVSDPYYVTPVLMGATMFLQQKMTPMMGDPIQQKIMMFLPIVFTFLFLTFPAGLVIYWTVNNLLTISQQFYIYKIAKD